MEWDWCYNICCCCCFVWILFVVVLCWGCIGLVWYCYGWWWFCWFLLNRYWWLDWIGDLGVSFRLVIGFLIFWVVGFGWVCGIVCLGCCCCWNCWRCCSFFLVRGFGRFCCKVVLDSCWWLVVRWCLGVDWNCCYRLKISFGGCWWLLIGLVFIVFVIVDSWISCDSLFWIFVRVDWCLDKLCFVIVFFLRCCKVGVGLVFWWCGNFCSWGWWVWYVGCWFFSWGFVWCCVGGYRSSCNCGFWSWWLSWWNVILDWFYRLIGWVLVCFLVMVLVWSDICWIMYWWLCFSRCWIGKIFLLGCCWYWLGCGNDCGKSLWLVGCWYWDGSIGFGCWCCWCSFCVGWWECCWLLVWGRSLDSVCWVVFGCFFDNVFWLLGKDLCWVGCWLGSFFWVNYSCWFWLRCCWLVCLFFW